VCAEVLGAQEDGSVDVRVAREFLAHVNAEYGSSLEFERGPYVILSHSDLSRRLSPDEQAIALPLSAQTPEEAVRIIDTVRARIVARVRRTGERPDRPCPSWVQALYVLGVQPQYIGHQCSPGQ
jgi:hypothetical protein